MPLDRKLGDVRVQAQHLLRSPLPGSRRFTLPLAYEFVTFMFDKTPAESAHLDCAGYIAAPLQEISDVPGGATAAGASADQAAHVLIAVDIARRIGIGDAAGEGFQPPTFWWPVTLPVAYELMMLVPAPTRPPTTQAAAPLTLPVAWDFVMDPLSRYPTRPPTYSKRLSVILLKVPIGSPAVRAMEATTSPVAKRDCPRWYTWRSR